MVTVKGGVGVLGMDFQGISLFRSQTIPDLSGRRVIDTSNPVKRTGIPAVLNQTSHPLRVDVIPPLNFLVGVLDSTSSGCKSTLHRRRARPVCISHKPLDS